MKHAILKRVLESLENELNRQKTANEQAATSATDSESKAESKWDTGGLEASYLARGYAQQAVALVQQVKELRAFDPPSFHDQPIGMGALVEADLNGYASFFFLLPCCGGMELEMDEHEVTVITLESPMGAALLGKTQGQTFTFRAGTSGKILRVE